MNRNSLPLKNKSLSPLKTLFKNYFVKRNFSKFLKNQGVNNSNNDDTNMSNTENPNKINPAYDYTKHSLMKCLFMFGYNKDNIGYILFEPKNKFLIGVDFGDFEKSKSIVEKLESKLEGRLRYILTTHIHGDHSGGNEQWKKERGDNIEIIAGDTPSERIPYCDKYQKDLEILNVGELCIACLHTPGHTKSAVCFVVTHVTETSTKIPIVFCGDTLFIGGCGRVFNGTYEELYNSLKTIAYLPNDTLIFPGHEYTQRNLEFCLKLDPENEFLREKYDWVKKMRERDEFTVGSRLIEERLYNPFFRAGDEYYLALTEETDPVKSFTKIRLLKDKF